MRINENTGGIPGIAVTLREGRAAKAAAGAPASDSVALGFAARYAEALREPSPAEILLKAAVRDGSYQPEPRDIASALLGKGFGQ
jgi:hypothetical protein